MPMPTRVHEITSNHPGSSFLITYQTKLVLRHFSHAETWRFAKERQTTMGESSRGESVDEERQQAVKGPIRPTLRMIIGMSESQSGRIKYNNRSR